LDLPEQPRVNLGQFLRCLAARRDRLDGGRVHPHRIRHLVHKLRQPVDGQTWPVLRLALLADGVRPLVARKKLQIREGVLAVLAIVRPRGFEALLRLLNDVNFGQGNLIGARGASVRQLWTVTRIWPMLWHMPEEATVGMERHVKLFKNGRNQAVRIPREFELPGEDAIMRKEGDKLIIEPAPQKRSLLELLDEWDPLDEEFPEIEDLPPEPVDF